MKKNCLLVFLFFFLCSLHSLFAQISIDELDADTNKEKNENIDSFSNTELENNIENYSRQIYVPATNPVITNIDANKSSYELPKQTFIDANWSDFLKIVDSTGKKYFVQFTASWCGPCKMMDREVFRKKEVIEIANTSYIAKLIDIDDFDGVQITQDLKIKSIPATIIFDCHGNELKRIEGFQYEDMFLNTLRRFE